MANLPNTVLDICQRVGMDITKVDVSLLTGTLDGYALTNRSSARSMLESLMNTFFFDAVESNGILKFVPINQPTVRTITLDELLPMGGDGSEASDYLVYQLADDSPVPKTVSVNYISRAAEYQQGSQEAFRQVVDDGEIETIELPMVLSDDKARQVAFTTLYTKYTARATFQFALPMKHFDLEAGDSILLTDGTLTHTIRIAKKKLANHMILIEGIALNPNDFLQSINGGEVSVNPPVIFDPGISTALYIDIPIIRSIDDDPGFYVGAVREGTSWPGTRVLRAATGSSNFGVLLTFDLPSVAGTTSPTVPLAGGVIPHIKDRKNFVDVILGFDGQLLSTDYDGIQSSDNSILIGNEIIQFETATLIGDRTYRLTNLYRGRLGTESFIEGHTTSERAIMLKPGSNFKRVSDSVTQINVPFNYKAVTVGQPVEDVTAETFANTGKGVKPWAPARFRATLAGDDWDLTWVYRSRHSGGWRDEADALLVETRESYRLQILNYPIDDTVVREVDILDVSQYTYTSAQQVEDFGSNQTTIKARVAQTGLIVGYYTTEIF